jgi:hypothetical protein
MQMTWRDKLLVIGATLAAFVVGLIISPDLQEWFRSLWR